MTLLDDLLASQGRTRADLPSTGMLGGLVRASGLPADEDFARVAALPRRPSATEADVDALSAWLRKNPGVRLRPPQVEALRELFEARGLFAPMRVGSGKTLVTLAAAVLLQARCPVLVIPASLEEKTKAEFATYIHDWHIRLPEIVSYQKLGHPDHEGWLERRAPDLLLLDEAHYLRNLDAAVTRRVGRYRAANPAAVFAALSGTLITEKIMDYWHLLVWTLGARAPVPLSRVAAERWALAVDREVGMLKRIAPGALDSLPGGFHGWLRASCGVVPTPGSDCPAAIHVTTWRPEIPAELRATIERVATSSMRPDGELLDEWDLPDCLCQLAQGFFYVWDPAPPDWWLRPRRGWRAYVRAVLDEHLPGFDSESPIVRALDREIKPSAEMTGPEFVETLDSTRPPAHREGIELLQAWRAVRDEFTPNPVPVWLSDEPLRQAAAHVDRHTLIWVKHRAAGRKLEDLGIPYFGGGTNPEPAAGRTIALSINAHGTGRNLQAWSRSLVLTPPANAAAWEQLIGRTHRAGQRADTVRVEIIAAIPYHGEVIGRVVTEARAVQRASGFDQKLCVADWT